jgi:predicted RNA methylase
MHDSFYTPDNIASYMVESCALTSPLHVADFAAGDGALLAHATKKWANLTVYATDIDVNAVNRLRSRNKSWHVSKCDFLTPASRHRSSLVQSLAGKVDLVLLNPPFSCKGAARFSVNVDSALVRCSRAIAFVLASMEYLNSNGEIVAILPVSCFSSQKDTLAWKILEERFTIRCGSTAGRGAFPGCFARCTVVRFSPRRRKKCRQISNAKSKSHLAVRLVRGSVAMHTDTGCDRTLVHSTDLLNSSVVLNGHMGSRNRPSVTGPSVLLPRVGKPRIDKVALYVLRKRVVLSDCVIGLQCRTKDDAKWLQLRIEENASEYLRIYSGTCAQYTTIKKLTAFLTTIGCKIEP